MDDFLDKPVLRNVCSKLADFAYKHLGNPITQEVWWVTVDAFTHSSCNGLMLDLNCVIAISEFGDCFLDDVDESRCEQ
jgi:hypothetical protein